MSTELLKIKHKYQEINRTNILGLKSRLPFFGMNGREGRSLYSCQVISRVDNSNMYLIHYDDGDRGELPFEVIKKYIKEKKNDDIFYIDDKENEGRVKGHIKASTNISKFLFLEDNNDPIHFGESVDIIYKFKNTPYISHFTLIFGSSNNNNIEVSILKVMKDMVLENVSTIKINTDQNIECNSYVSWIKISISAQTKLKKISIFYCKFRNKVIGNYDNIFTKENPLMIPTKNEDFCDLYITHKEIKSLDSEYIPIEKHFLKVCGVSNPLLAAYNFALKNDKMYKGKPYIRILCEKEVLPIFVSLMTGTFKIPKKIKYIIDIYKILKEYLADILVLKIENIIKNLKISQLLKLYSKKLNNKPTKKLYYIIVKNIKDKIKIEDLKDLLIKSYDEEEKSKNITSLLLEIMVMYKNSIKQ